MATHNLKTIEHHDHRRPGSLNYRAATMMCYINVFGMIAVLYRSGRVWKPSEMRKLKRWLAQKTPWLYYSVRGIRTAGRTAFGPGYLRRQVKNVAPLRIVIGSSGVYEQGWIPTNIEYLNLLDESHWQRALSEDSVDAILAEHVWEHLTPEQGESAAQRCFRYLKPGGYLRVAVPDGYHPNPQYIDWVKVDGVGPGADDHKVLYTYETFRDLFERVGFNVNLLEYHDAEGKFHRNPWDVTAGKIHRVEGRDFKSGDFPGYSSIILDACKHG